MREIKFRAWDKEEKKMWTYEDELCYFCNCEITEENDCFDPELEYVCCIKCYKEQGFKEMTSDEYLW